MQQLASLTRGTAPLADISDMAGYEPGSLNRWFNGENSMKVEAFYDIAEAIGYTVILVPTKSLPARA